MGYAAGQCSYCSIENHCCLICGEDGNGEAGKVVKCSMGVCGKFYHPQCVFSNPLTNVLQGTWIPVGSVDGDKTGMRFRCPQHYCRTCGLSGANIYSVTCIRCPYAYHSRYQALFFFPPVTVIHGFSANTNTPAKYFH